LVERELPKLGVAGSSPVVRSFFCVIAMKFWNLLIDNSSQKGSWNMAVDDYLFRSVEKENQTYLRFYSWERPTASLGYSQKAADVLDLEACRDQGIDVVRRITGGKMVLHFHEVTYSLCSADSGTFTATLSDSYRMISLALLEGLRGLGFVAALAASTPPHYARSNLPCFSHPARDEIEFAGKKIVGSAQKRVGARFLQHGSILLDDDTALLRRISLPNGVDSELNMTSLGQILGREIAFDSVVEQMVKGFSSFFQVRFRSMSFAPEEVSIIQKIQKERYEDSAWIHETG
jgi:lipoate-protein ligase A